MEISDISEGDEVVFDEREHGEMDAEVVEVYESTETLDAVRGLTMYPMSIERVVEVKE